MTDAPDPELIASPFEMLGGRDRVLTIAEAFYDHMEAHEPELTATHRQVSTGIIHPEVRERFGLFLIGWLGGPQDYMATYGHPRLRMRHARVPIDSSMRDAWMRAMRAALDVAEVDGALREFLEKRLGHVANFLRNRPDPT